MSAPAHLNWLVDTGERLKSADGVEIEVRELQYGDDPAVLSAWAKHFREHYCDEEMLKKLVAGTGETHAQYLLNKKFPDEKNPPGPIIRSVCLSGACRNWTPHGRFSIYIAANH
jgi:hypothetical protein